MQEQIWNHKQVINETHDIPMRPRAQIESRIQSSIFYHAGHVINHFPMNSVDEICDVFKEEQPKFESLAHTPLGFRGLTPHTPSQLPYTSRDHSTCDRLIIYGLRFFNRKLSISVYLLNHWVLINHLHVHFGTVRARLYKPSCIYLPSTPCPVNLSRTNCTFNNVSFI